MPVRSLWELGNAPVRRPKRTSIVRSISRAGFELRGERGFDLAVREAVAWIKARTTGVSDAAFDGADFSADGDAARALTVATEGGRIWAATLDDPDSNVPRRTWVTEISISESADVTTFAARLRQISQGEDAPYVASRPGCVLQMLAAKFNAYADGRPITDRTQIVDTEADTARFLAFVCSPTRRLPVLALSELSDGATAVDVAALTQRVAGLTHMFLLTERASWALTAAVGTPSSVFRGAARLYNSGFTPDQSDPFEHPLWLRARGPQAREAKLNLITHQTLTSSLMSLQGEGDQLWFDDVRHLAASLANEQARTDATDADLVALYEAEIRELQGRLAQQKSLNDDLLVEASVEKAAAERMRDDVLADNSQLRGRILKLEGRLYGWSTDALDRPLDAYEHIDEWCSEHLAGSIWVSPKAIRETEKNRQFQDIDLFSRTLLMLRDTYVPMKRSTGPERAERFAAYEAALARLGLKDSKCFADLKDIKRFPAYSVVYRGDRYWCEDHIKCGTGTNPMNMFRIYMHWHEEDSILLIGHMPTHLDNNRTN